MSKSALTVLREARELISDPKRWVQKGYAKDEAGNWRLPLDERAVCWCADGAIQRAGSEDTLGKLIAREYLSNAAVKLFPDIVPVLHEVAYVDVNDELGHTATIRMFDAAIASAEKEAQS